MDVNQGLDSVPIEEWLSLRAKLVGKGSTALLPDPGGRPRPAADWHDAVAADAEQDGDALGAEWHLDRLAALRPKDWTIPARCGRVLAAAGRRDEAAAAYARATRLAPSGQVLSDWLRAAAADDEAAGRKDAALWNLDRAVKLTPEDWVPYAIRAALAEQAGQAARAVADMDAAIRLGAEATVIVQAAQRAVRSKPAATRPIDWARVATLLTSAAKDSRLPIEHCYHLAVACLKAGDGAGYKAACAGIAKRLPAGAPMEPGDVFAAAKAFTLGPGASDDWSTPLSWVDQVLAGIAKREAAEPSVKKQLEPLRHLFLHIRGALLYRAGQPKEATAALRDPASVHPMDSEFCNRAYLALTRRALGQTNEAKAAAALARAAQPRLKDDQVWERAEVELLGAELDAALPPAGK
jgi:Flp pilus assembly protein TadD